MAITKKYDLVVATREYTDGQGNKKKAYQNIGAVMEGDNGPYIMLERWFNPAGIGGGDGRSSIIVSMFEPNRDRQGGGQQQRQAGPDLGDGDNIPF